MTPETVKQFQEAVSMASWNLNYTEFCHHLGRKEPDWWTAKMWGEFKALEQTLRAFDSTTLAKLITTPIPHPENCQTGLDPASGKSWTAEEILRREG